MRDTKSARLAVLFCVAAVFFLSAATSAEEDPQKLYTGGSVNKEVPFVMPIEKAQFQALLDRLLNTRLRIKRKYIIDSIAEDLHRMDIKPGQAGGLEAMAEALYEEQVESKLKARVAKFNELTNDSLDDDKVSAGLLAFDGLAEGMSDTARDTVSTYIADAGYFYRGGAFGEKGKWKYPDEVWMTGTENFSRFLTASIEETIEIDLEDLGKEEPIELKVRANGEVKLEQTFGCKQLNRPKGDGSPSVRIRYQPFAKVTASKSISDGMYFDVVTPARDEPLRPVHKTFNYPAVHVVDFEAQRPARLRDGSKEEAE
jgi:hypothetical protein